MAGVKLSGTGQIALAHMLQTNAKPDMNWDKDINPADGWWRPVCFKHICGLNKTSDLAKELAPLCDFYPVQVSKDKWNRPRKSPKNTIRLTENPEKFLTIAQTIHKYKLGILYARGYAYHDRTHEIYRRWCWDSDEEPKDPTDRRYVIIHNDKVYKNLGRELFAFKLEEICDEAGYYPVKPKRILFALGDTITRKACNVFPDTAMAFQHCSIIVIKNKEVRSGRG